MPSSAPLIRALKGRIERVKKISLLQIVDASAHPAALTFATRQFASAGAYGGEPWAGYAGEPLYAAFKQAQGAPMKPLRWSPKDARLEPALTSPRHPDHRWVKGPRGWTLDVSIGYLAQLETGGIGPFGERFPARRIFPRREALTRDVMEQVKREFYKQVKTATRFKTKKSKR